MTGTSTQTTLLNSEGVRLLNFWRLAPDEQGHTDALLDMLALPATATVVDLGSGTGEFARLALNSRPDLDFLLVNNNEWQLQQSPTGTTTFLADMAATNLPTGCADAVVLAYALGHGDVVEVLEEAHRLLKPGGKLLLHDVFAPTHVEAADFKAALNYDAHNATLLGCWTALIGFDLEQTCSDQFLAPGETVRSVAPLVTRMQHGVAVYVKSNRPHRFADRNVALQLSGGKDSVACLYLLKPFLNKYINTYWLNTGDVIPETLAVMSQLRAWVPNFAEIQSDVKAWRTENGMPSDLVPARAHFIGRTYGMATNAISNRFDCCAANLMFPMHKRMIADGIDLIIRGTKLSDTGKLPAEGWQGNLEIWLPLRDFTHEDVFALLADVGAPVSPVYTFAKGISAPECFGCTAWWDDNKAEYLRAWHPEQYLEYKKHLTYIAGVVHSHMADLYKELTEI